MTQTAVEWLFLQMENLIIKAKVTDMDNNDFVIEKVKLLQQAKEMEKNDTDNKVIHFAEWLTKKHTSTLITLYEQFEEEYYKETFKSEQNESTKNKSGSNL